MMRIRESRGSILAKHRIGGLRRFAFAGDSFTYSQGVPPTSALPECAARHLNELSVNWPVEAINYGVCGYNLWNDWLAFKNSPQIFDGLILTLCHNDADLFCRTYKIQYQEPRADLWEESHPYGAAVVKCFEDIKAFSNAHKLPVAICFYNCWKDESSLRTGQIIKDLAEKLGLLYIDANAYLKDRNYPKEMLQVSAADGHPSPEVHTAIGKLIADTIHRDGWLKDDEAPSVQRGAERVLLAAKDLVLKEGYPADQALHWAAATLDAKKTTARRLQFVQPDFDPDLISSIYEEVMKSTQCWHIGKRLNAFMSEVAMGGYRLSSILWSSEELRVQLTELGFALSLGNWRHLSKDLVQQYSGRKGANSQSDLDAGRPVFEGPQLLVRVKETFEKLRELTGSLAPVSFPDVSPVADEFNHLSGLVRRLEAECDALDGTISSFWKDYDATASSLSDNEKRFILDLVWTSVEHVQALFLSFSGATSALERILDVQANAFTTVEITIRAPAAKDSAPYWVTVQGEYSLPSRFLFSDNANFIADGADWHVKAYLPIMYTGRLTIRPWVRTIADQVAEVTLTKVEVYNQPNQRRAVPMKMFRRDEFGQYVSSQIFLI